MFRKHPSTGEIGALILEGDYFTLPVKLMFLQDGRISEGSTDYARTIMMTDPCKDQNDFLPLYRELQKRFEIRVINKRQKR